MTVPDKEYDVILIDTSIFDRNGLRLEKGLLGRLSQFRKSPIELLFPDVIKNEVQLHLEKKINKVHMDLKKSLNNAREHSLINNERILNNVQKMLVASKEVERLGERLGKERIEDFILKTGALVLNCGNYVSVEDLLDNYFSNQPPFQEKGKKKNEFPDAIILMAVEEWAKQEEKSVLAISSDNDWNAYCEISERIDYKKDLSDGLDIFNKVNAPHTMLANLEKALENNSATEFLRKIGVGLNAALDGLIQDQDAESVFILESEGLSTWFKEFQLQEDKFRIIDVDESFVVLETNALITVEAEGYFSCYLYDSIDKEYVYMGGISETTEESFASEILLVIKGDLDGDINQLTIERVEVVHPISSVNFGDIWPEENHPEFIE